MREYLLPKEAAERLHVSPKTISRWAREEKISFIQTLGGHRRFNAEMIDQMAQERGHDVNREEGQEC